MTTRLAKQKQKFQIEVKMHSFRVCFSLLHSFRVYFFHFSTRFECIFSLFLIVKILITVSYMKITCCPQYDVRYKPLLNLKITLETSGVDENLHSKRVGKMKTYTRNEWGRTPNLPDSQPDSNVFGQKQ